MYTTNSELLEKVREGDEAAWRLFRDTYRPLIYHCAKQWGLTPDDYPELEQIVLLSFFRVNPNFVYDPQKGKFRSYLGIIMKNCISSIFRHKKLRAEMNKALEIQEKELDDSFEEEWNREWKIHLFWLSMKNAAEQMPEKAFQAFELLEMKGKKAADVASALGISVPSVYNYRKKVIDFLRGNIAEISREEVE